MFSAMYAELNMVITTAARNSEFCGKSSGNASGTSVCDMNSSVIRGTPRNISMKATQSSFTTGRLLRRPSASAIPMGRLRLIPPTARIRFSVSPPQYTTDTGCSPGKLGMPRNRASVIRKAATPQTTAHRGWPSGVYLATAHPTAVAGRLASSRIRTSHPMRSKLYGRKANRAATTATSIAMRLATPPPRMAQIIPSSAVTMSSDICGRQKQFCPGQASSVL